MSQKEGCSSTFIILFSSVAFSALNLIWQGEVPSHRCTFYNRHFKDPRTKGKHRFNNLWAEDPNKSHGTSATGTCSVKKKVINNKGFFLLSVFYFFISFVLSVTKESKL